MGKNPKKKMQRPTLQKFELVPITDPAELEAIDRRRKEAMKVMREAERAYDAVLRKHAKRKAPKHK
jgi:sugar-specific transcriptional regulator TrmB